MPLQLILGGARSGKSRHAETLALRSGEPVTVIATAQGLDEEMIARIGRHKADRPPHWRTVESPVDLAATLAREAQPGRHLIVDCLTLWLSNLLDGAEHLTPPADAANLPLFRTQRDALLDTLPQLPGTTLLIANEIGLGLVPETPLGRLFRDEAGRLNQTLAARCERVVFVAAGLPLTLKPTATNV